MHKQYTMKNIGIVGAGIAGLHLGLYLQQHGIQATIYTDQSPERLRQSRLMNIVGRAAHTRARERRLGVDHWERSPDRTHMSLFVGGERPLTVQGTFDQPISMVDMRMYLCAAVERFCNARR
jgi:2-polyprenyl-6-methoxyphenol hydroxylase-like FAD-dependent oxidoreductase